MQPHEALAILDALAAEAKMNRRDHSVALEAVDVLAKLIAAPKEADNKNVTQP